MGRPMMPVPMNPILLMLSPELLRLMVCSCEGLAGYFIVGI